MKSKEMKKKLKRIVSCAVFLALVWTVFVHCTYLFRDTTGMNRPQILGFYLEEPDSLDVVFVGPSSVHNFWDPMLAWHEYGFTSYSYSAPGMTSDVTLYCLKDIQKTQNPVVVVVDVRRYLARFSTGDINNGKYRNLLDSLDIDLERLEAVNYVRKLRSVSMKDIITEFVDLIYYHNNRSVLANEPNWALWDNRVGESPYYGQFYKGSRIWGGRIHQFCKRPEILTEETSPLKAGNERTLRDFLTYCQKNNVQVMLIASPYVFSEENLKEFNMIAKIANEYSIPFLNVNQHLNKIDLDYSTDFQDSSHTNILGMEKYTRYIAEYLKEHYSIPERHDDTIVAAWNELYTKYEKDAKKFKDQTLTTVTNKTQAIADEDSMRMTLDAREWLSLADNDNMTVFVLMDQNSRFSPSLVNEQLLKTYGLTTAILAEDDHYFCVYSGKKVSSTISEPSLSGKFGSRDENKLEYSLSIGEQSQIMVGDRNYIERDQKGLHMVVFDNNTYNFVDSVTFTISANGELHLEHNYAA